MPPPWALPAASPRGRLEAHRASGRAEDSNQRPTDYKAPKGGFKLGSVRERFGPTFAISLTQIGKFKKVEPREPFWVGFGSVREGRDRRA
jgi:hypothetical protein